MGKLSRIGLLATLAVVFSSTSSFAAVTTGGSHTARPLITSKVDDSKLVTLRGNTNPATLVAADDRGPVADDFAMPGILLQLKRSPEQEQALNLLMDQLHTPGNPNFHKWLSEAQYDETFGVNQSDVAKVVAWLEAKGFTVTGVTPDGMVIQFSGTAGTVRDAFHTSIHNLELKNGQKHIANMSDPQIPAALATVVLGPTALHDFKPHATNVQRSKVAMSAPGAAKKDLTRKPTGDYTFTYSCDNGQETCTEYAFVPGDAQTIYNIKPLLTAGTTGHGQSIGLIEDSNAYNSTNGVSADWTEFMKTFGLTSYGGTQTTVQPSGGLTCTNPGVVVGTDFEVALDVDYAAATAPGANLIIESCADTNTAFGGLIAVENLVSAATITVPVLSISYGECEAYNGASSNASYYYAYQHGAARGVSIFVSSGDESSRSCDADENDAETGLGVSAFTSTPYNVSVGGTDFGDTYANNSSTYWNSTNSATYESAKSYIPEIPWNDSCASQLITTTLYNEGAPGLTTSNTYGAGSACNVAPYNYTANNGGFLTTASGSGGASNCYTGAPSVEYVGTTGTCKGQPKPSWQSVYGNPADGVRDIPDVSLFASNGIWGHYLVLCYSDAAGYGTPCVGQPPYNWSGAGGTSASSPMMAGIQTLINQYNGELSGNPNYVYYKLASKEYGSSGSSSCNSSNGASGTSSCTFYDVTLGDMNVPCSYYSGTTAYNCYDTSAELEGVGSLTNGSYSQTYATTKGWDFATGIGTVNAYNLATNWKSATAGGYPFTASVSVVGSSSTYASGSGSSVTYTVTVTGNGTYPTGTVTLYNTTVSPTTAVGTGTLTPLASGNCGSQSGTCTETATISYSPGSLAAKTYTITATYSGTNENYATASGTTTLQVTTGSATTTTALTVTPTTVGYGQNVTMKAVVTASAGTANGGTVTFKADGVSLDSCTLVNGTCSVSPNTAGEPLGSYALTAVYGGTTGFDGSTSSVVTGKLEAAVTTTTLVITPSEITPPASGTLTATVARPSGYSGFPTGTVYFYYGSTYLGSAALSNGVAAFHQSTSGIPAGNYTLTAKYLGDGGDGASQGTAVAHLN